MILFFAVVFGVRAFVWEAIQRIFFPTPHQIVDVFVFHITESQEMNEVEYKQIAATKSGLYEGDAIASAARKVNLTIQSVLKQEDLVIKQLESIEREESLSQRVVVPIHYSCSCFNKHDS